MPIFDWKCEVCGHVWEQTVKMHEVVFRCPKDIADELKADEYTFKHIEYTEKHPYKIKKLPPLTADFGSNWSRWNPI